MILVVDLDGTLLKSNMLYESFWSAFALRLDTPFKSMTKLLCGKAALKSYLASAATIDIASLPYDNEVIKYINDYRAKGGKVALITATNHLLAEKIANHLNIFDEVFGSDGNVNLKGAVKAGFLVKRFGRGNFCYMGDSYADLPIWENAGKVVTVNAHRSLCRQTEALDKPFEHLKTFNHSWLPYLIALRPHQWLKNILIFVPVLAAHKFDVNLLLSSIQAFIAFCLIASSVYIFNDLLDLNADRAHIRKRLRPFASGVIPLFHGNIIAFVLLSGGIVIAAFLNWMFLFAIGAYYVISLAYSLVLKRKVVIDICILAGLYTMRILAGGFATGIELSIWLLAFSVFFFLSLAAVKRQAELVDLAEGDKMLVTGRGYKVQDLPIITIISMTSGYISVFVLMLYINSPNVINLYQTPEILLGICCILLYWLTRTVLVTQRGSMHDDPVVFAAKDRISQICFIIILGLVISGALL